MRSLLDHIRALLPKLRPSEQQVAQQVLNNPGNVIHMRIVDLAQEASVSEPTVVRFCRNIDCSGFQAFKLELAQQLGAGMRTDTLELQDSDNVGQITQKIFDSTLLSLRTIRDNLSATALQQACTVIGEARTIECIGYGGSHPIAVDAQTKLFRLGIKTNCNADSHIQRMSIMALTSRDAVLAISQSGRSMDLVQVLEQVRYEGAQIIGIGPGDSPMATHCDVFLAVNDTSLEDTASPLPTRLAHMLVVDVLVAALVLQLGNIGLRHIENMNTALEKLRIPPKKPRKKS